MGGIKFDVIWCQPGSPIMVWLFGRTSVPASHPAIRCSGQAVYTYMALWASTGARAHANCTDGVQRLPKTLCSVSAMCISTRQLQPVSAATHPVVPSTLPSFGLRVFQLFLHTHAHTHTQIGCSSCHLTSPCPPAESPRTAVVGQLFRCRVKPVLRVSQAQSACERSASR